MHVVCALTIDMQEKQVDRQAVIKGLSIPLQICSAHDCMLFPSRNVPSKGETLTACACNLLYPLTWFCDVLVFDISVFD